MRYLDQSTRDEFNTGQCMPIHRAGIDTDLIGQLEHYFLVRCVSENYRCTERMHAADEFITNPKHVAVILGC